MLLRNWKVKRFRLSNFERPQKCMPKCITRWFKVPFSSPSWRSLNPLKGSRFHHPKKVTNWITRYFFFPGKLRRKMRASLKKRSGWVFPEQVLATLPKCESHLAQGNGRYTHGVPADAFGWFLGVSLNGSTPKSSILIGFSIINHPFWGTSIFGNTHFLVWFFFWFRFYL